MERELGHPVRLLGEHQPPYVIAEIGANHNGDMQLCRRLVDAAVQCGAQAAKFQSWSEDSLLSREARQNADLLEQVRRYKLSPAQHREIQAYCQEKGIQFISTAFSVAEADMLEEMGVPFYKIASMDVNHLPFLRHIARKGKPILLSTGMATLGEIERALEAIGEQGNDQVVLLHCVSLYPPDPALVNLRNIPMLADTFSLPVGYSDHTIGVGTPLAAIALGASVIEKHFTLDKNLEGWDHAVSADPDELSMIVREGRLIWQSLGSRQRMVSDDERDKARFFRRSLVASRPLKAGEHIDEQDLDYKRPGTGIRPDQVGYVLGRELRMNVEQDEMLTWEHLQ